MSLPNITPKNTAISSIHDSSGRSKIEVIIIIAAILIFVSIVVAFVMIRLNSHSRIEKLCLRYEEENTLPPNSCECAAKLYHNWEVSYDWMDACEILENKKQESLN